MKIVFAAPPRVARSAALALLAAVALARPLALSGAEPTAPIPKKSAAHDTNPHDILVYSTISDAGQKVVHPTPDKPVYYLAVAGGFHQEGPSVARDDAQKVTADEVAVPLRKALTAQGYLPVAKGMPPPTLLIVFHWGVQNPEFIDGPPADGDTPQVTKLLNAKKMGDLVGASRVERDLESEYGEMVTHATENRYIVIVSAFDFAAATAKIREKKLIWRTRLSLPSDGTTLPATIVPMIASGAPFFGRDTPHPKEIHWDRASVEIGTPTVVPSDKK